MTKEEYKVYNEVFDRSTLRTLDKLKGDYYEEIEYCISTGKEANVFRAKTKKGYVAIKIYRTYTSSFDNMAKYIDGDPRFPTVKRKKHDLVYQWCKKEFRNLSKAYVAGVSVPKPYTSMKNVLIMEFIGSHGVPAPLIKDALVQDYQLLYNKIVDNVVKMLEIGLIHADLSEFNILYYKDRPILIDMAQSVLKDHPLAYEFFKKDINNLNRFFKKKCNTKPFSFFEKIF